MRHLIAFKLNDGHHWDFYGTSPGWNSGQQPVYYRRVGELDDELVHDGINPDRPANRCQTKIWWINRDEMLSVETPQLFEPHSACHGRDVVHIGLRNHCSHRGVRVAGFELAAAVLFPKCNQVSICHTTLHVSDSRAKDLSKGRNRKLKVAVAGSKFPINAL